jgi:hypothetical protein
MKKRNLLIALVFCLSLLVFLSAENATLNVDSTSEQSTEITLKNSAYTCVEAKVRDKGCSSLTVQEQIFALLSIGKCQSELMQNSDSGKCWPKANCDVKTTAQAILALDNAGYSVEKPVEWLLNEKTISPKELDWFLQIETNEASICSIKYRSNSYSINLREDKSLAGSPGPCFSISNKYWLKISPSCYDENFEISCDKSFQTNLYYQRTGSNVKYVSDQTHSESAGSKTNEKVSSKCFSNNGNECNYEASLWASLLINHKKGAEIVSSYFPYLQSLMSVNRKYLPESFLYSITGSSYFRTSLLNKQKLSKYWEESDYGRYYDTALALMPFGSEVPTQKASSISWLTDASLQNDQGCWDNGNLVSTSFLLFSIWPRTISPEQDSSPSCTQSNYFCLSQLECQGNILNSYSCPGTLKCCDTQKTTQTCSAQGGIICNSNQVCQSGTSVEASDLSFSQTCCFGGVCVDQTTTQSQCQGFGGNCRISCFSGEEEKNYACEFTSDVCCMQEEEKSSSLWWLWLLLILVILVAFAIIFREKLKEYWFKFKNRNNKGSSNNSQRPFSPGNPPYSSPPIRRIMPPGTNSRPPMMQRSIDQKQRQMNQVLNQLKQMKQ